MCRTLRSIVHRARYSNFYLSFSGTRGADLSAVQASCPEMRSLVTAVFSARQAEVIDDIVEHLWPSIVKNMNVQVTVSQSTVADTTAKMIARHVVSQWYAMKNAINDLLPNAEVNTERYLIVVEDDVVFAEDFDELVRAAIVEAEQRSAIFAISLYDNDSSGDDSIQRAATDASDNDIDGFEAFGESLSSPRGTAPLLIEGQFGGRQAVLYSGRILDTLRVFFDTCDHDTRADLIDLDFLREEGASAHMSSQASAPCISPIGFFDAYVDMMVNEMDETRMRFFKMKDSLVQHIGSISAVPGVHEIFLTNRKLGTVSEEYSIENSLQIREQAVSRAPSTTSRQ